jgi:hypothetical protein
VLAPSLRLQVSSWEMVRATEAESGPSRCGSCSLFQGAQKTPCNHSAAGQLRRLPKFSHHCHVKYPWLPFSLLVEVVPDYLSRRSPTNALCTTSPPWKCDRNTSIMNEMRCVTLLAYDLRMAWPRHSPVEEELDKPLSFVSSSKMRDSSLRRGAFVKSFA